MRQNSTLRAIDKWKDWEEKIRACKHAKHICQSNVNKHLLHAGTQYASADSTTKGYESISKCKPRFEVLSEYQQVGKVDQRGAQAPKEAVGEVQQWETGDKGGDKQTDGAGQTTQ